MSRGTKDLIRGGAPGAARAPAVEPQPPAGAASMRRRPSSDAPLPPVERGPTGRAAAAAAPGAVPNDSISQLTAKVEAQRRELDERTDNVNAIQRNFQRLSEMYAGDRGKMDKMTAELEAAKKELESLRAERKVHMALRNEFVALQGELQRVRSENEGGASKVEEERDALKAQVRELKEELALAQRTLDDVAKEQAQQAQADSGLLDALAVVTSDVDRLFSELHGVQMAAGLVAPLLGSGLTPTATSAAKATARDANDVTGHLQGLHKSLHACSTGAFGAVHRTLEESTQRHEGALQELAENHALAIKTLEAERDEAVAKAAHHKQQAAEAADKLKQAGKMFALERQTLASQLSDGKNTLAAQLAERERELAEQQAIVRELTDQEQRSAGERAAMENTIDTLRAELAAAVSARDEASSTAGDASAAAAAEIAQLRADLQQARQIGDSAATDASQQRSKAERLAKELREAEATAQAARAAWDAERQKLLSGSDANAAAAAAARQTIEAQLRAQIEALTVEIGQLRDRSLQDAAAAKDLRTDLERDLERAQHDLAVKSDEALTLTMQVEQLTADLREARGALEALQLAAGRAQGDADGKAGQLERTVAEQRAKIADLHAQIAGMEQTIKALADEAKAAREEAAGAKAMHAVSAGDMAAKDKECAQLRSALQHANEAKAQAEAKAESLTRKAAASEQAASEAIARARRLEDFKDSSKERAAELEQQMIKVDEWRGNVQTLQRESVKAVKKVLAAEEACESSYSCLSCMEVMRDPVVCAPCGHSYCRACLVSANKGGAAKPGRGISFCPECDDDMITHVLPSKNLDQLASRFDFRKRALKELTTMLERTYADIEAGGSATSPVKKPR